LTKEGGDYRLKPGGTARSAQKFGGNTLNKEVVFG
jgi:hypothetical protein